MTLAAAVTARYSNEFLVGLTNQADRAATTVDTTILGYAATDVEAQFAVLTGLTYDDTDAAHVAACCPGVLWQLQRYTGKDDKASGSFFDQFKKATDSIALTTGSRAKAPVATTARYDPTREELNELPPFDRNRQRNYEIGWPNGQDSSDLPNGG